MSRSPDVPAHKKGQPYFLPRDSYLTANLYKTWWMTDKNQLREEQVLAETIDSARNKINRKFGIPKSKIGASLVMRKGAFKGVGLRYIK